MFKYQKNLEYAALQGAAKLKANWSCTSCGMYSGRRYSVQRHINRIHKGYGTAIPFIEYLIGRRNGWYPPGPLPRFAPAERSLLDKMREEGEKVYSRRVAEQCFPPVGDPSYANHVDLLKSCFFKRTT